MRQKPAASMPVSACGSETISQTVKVKPYLWASGEVTQPLNEASIVFTCHLRHQHTHSLSSMASILILFNHLCISTTQTLMITMPQCNFVVTLYILSCRKFLNFEKTWTSVFAESEFMPSVCWRIHLEADVLEEDLQERQCQLLQLIHKMTVNINIEIFHTSALKGSETSLNSHDPRHLQVTH